MFAAFARAWRSYQGASAFKALPEPWRQLVFYSEDDGSSPHLGPLLSELASRGHKITYLTSSEEDPLLSEAPQNVKVLCIGSGAARTTTFMALDARVMVMTMPDLETFHIKRSKTADVHYLYVFHSIVSTHMIYRTAAFDHFDSLLCVGPHHVEEIRAREKLENLPAKSLLEHGYARLDAIVADRPEPGPREPGPLRVLIAPSWGPTGLIELYGEAVVLALLRDGLEVILRPHPRTSRDHAGLIDGLMKRHEGAGLSLDQAMSSRDSLLRSDVMISDWSGAALEYAFGLDKPVVFVDVPRKVNNPHWQALGIEPVEASVREHIGRVVAVDDLASLPEVVRELCADPGAFAEAIAKVRERSVYNTGRSHAAVDQKIQLRRSSDQGRTWGEPRTIVPPINKGAGVRDPHIVQLADGRLLLSYFSHPEYPPTREPGDEELDG